jgi:hypothetical protein
MAVMIDYMRGNQLPVSAARWQHDLQICFATFIAYNSTTTKAREKISTDLEYFRVL